MQHKNNTYYEEMCFEAFHKCQTRLAALLPLFFQVPCKNSLPAFKGIPGRVQMKSSKAYWLLILQEEEQLK